MSRYSMDDGTIVDTKKASKLWDEDTRWDGRNHIDVNYFTYEENVKQANAFESAFRTSKSLTTKLRDEQPRGIGRVVSYFSDLDENLEPHWAF